MHLQYTPTVYPYSVHLQSLVCPHLPTPNIGMCNCNQWNSFAHVSLIRNDLSSRWSADNTVCRGVCVSITRGIVVLTKYRNNRDCGVPLGTHRFATLEVAGASPGLSNIELFCMAHYCRLLLLLTSSALHRSIAL